MCDACKGESAVVRGFTRRAFFALAAGGLGAATMGLWSCREEPKKPHPATGESVGTGTGTASGPATTATTRAPAPDLGAEVFPDASGKAIASINDAPVIIIPRSDWTSSGPNLYEIEVMNGVQQITVHHTAGELQTDSWRETAGALEGIRNFHSGTQPSDRHWADIAYHFVIDRAGRVWQARPLAYQGAHVRGHNEHNLGIVLLGNFEIQTPAAAQLVALAGFIAFARRIYTIPMSEVHTHGELGKTSCPGKKLQAYMDRARKSWAIEDNLGAASRPATGPTASH
jgi:hypothetical protein